MPTTSNPLELVTLLHAAAIDASRWGDFLQCLSVHTRSVTGAVLSQGARSAELDAIAIGGLDPNPAAQKSYNDHYRGQDPFFEAALQSRPQAVVSDEELVPRELLKKGVFYNEFLRPSGMEHGVMLPHMSERGTDLISLWRNQRQGPMDIGTLHLLDTLVPHIRFAFTLRRDLDGAALRLDCLTSMLHAVSAPALLLDLRGKLVLMSRSAQALLQQHDGLSLHRQRLRAASPGAQRKLETLISACAAQPTPREGAWRGVLIPRPSGRRDLQALVCPVVLPGEPHHSLVHILVVLRDPACLPGLSPELLHDLYGFSPAEASVANALLEGLSPEQISQRRHVSSGTVRNQLKSLLAKSGTRSQADLLRGLATLPKDRLLCSPANEFTPQRQPRVPNGT